ncbi:MAG: IclR family transcriptional regulator [Alphaproteobacteria bacterium]|jgi:DNA-binding IclR family transcriptional regulator|nr:IclR family transcriptional regulator [Alphaproteobacteria bacterium]MBU1401797.1 IclR family transcriptional regulator [Alphaproteobacteria bacterium]MBU2106135.1 IclR family transcriptional regulator [Alphaproteobacteria bacterium]MBU2190104.1 IclR family transcriptional regulator [Alphaproteobacteria bacterium]MBU2313733.1 IclR family transcriptional regulator [Alphaproteobacteria bacterium]
MKPIPEEPMNRIPEDRAVYSAPALEKGLDILELLAAEATPMTAREIGERLGRSKSEIFRMVFVLVERGYLHRDAATDQLTLSNRLFELGMRTPRSRTLVEVALPAMERLSKAVGHAVHLVVVNRGETVVVANATPPTEFNFSLQLGYSRPAMDAASGQTVIAFQDKERRRTMIEESFARVEREADLDALNEELDRIAKAGSVVSPSHHFVGVTDVCAPVLDKSGKAIASVVMPCLQKIGNASGFEDIRNSLVETCREISSGLI